MSQNKSVRKAQVITRAQPAQKCSICVTDFTPFTNERSMFINIMWALNLRITR